MHSLRYITVLTCFLHRLRLAPEQVAHVKVESLSNNQIRFSVEPAVGGSTSYVVVLYNSETLDEVDRQTIPFEQDQASLDVVLNATDSTR